MKNKEQLYNHLKKDYTDEELADSYIFSIELSEEEAKAAHEEFLKLRFALLDKESEQNLMNEPKKPTK